MRRSTIVWVALAATVLGASATDGYTNFNYALDNPADNGLWGTNKLENYDIAMLLKNPAVTGKKVTKVSVPVPESGALGDYSIWLSHELKLESKVNAPDIASYVCDPKDGWLTLELPTPVIIPEEGLYVGFSFTVSALDDETRYPVVATDYINRPGSFYIHTSRTYKQWKDAVESFYVAPYINVTVAGDFTPDNLALVGVLESNITKGDGQSILLKVRNEGGNPIQSIGCKVNLRDGQTLVEELVPMSTPLQPSVLNSTTIELPVAGSALASIAPGYYLIDVMLTDVNGQANAATASSGTGDFHLMPFIPVHKPVLEEYTGLWCGYCPRGFVGLQIMNHLYPEDFIGISIHNGDAMSVVPRDDFPSDIVGFPDAWIDRVEHTDAYSGRRDGVFGVDEVWAEARSKVAPADIRIEAGFTDHDHNTIYVAAYNTFVKKNSTDSYRQVFILTADGLSNENWTQANYYAKDTGFEGTPWRDYWAPFVDGSGNVRGLVFDDVLIAFTDLKGVGHDIPVDYQLGREVKMTHRFTVADIVNEAGVALIQDPSKLNAVVLLVNAETGAIENANKVPVKVDPADVRTVEGCCQIREVKYYDLSGRRLAEPTEGIFVRRTEYTDGTVRTDKIVNRNR